MKRGARPTGRKIRFFGLRPTVSHVTARDEVKALIDALKLPIDERGKRRVAARAEWLAASGKPLETHDLLAD